MINYKIGGVSLLRNAGVTFIRKSGVSLDRRNGVCLDGISNRVQNIEGLLKKLKQNGVTILDTILTVDYGKFVHIIDSDGNKIELWEPVDSVLTKLGGNTTK